MSDTPAETRSEAFDVNSRLGLLCIDDGDRRTGAAAAVEELGYRVHVGTSADDAAERVRKTSYDVVVVDQAFQGASPHDNPFLAKLQALPMTVRRSMFVTLLGAQFKTFDAMMAFAKSVNLVVGYNDIAQLKAILQRGVADNDQFYRVFRQVLAEKR
jgi:CheY-like chemotaxis protein